MLSGRGRIAVLYLLFFSTVGISLPFFPGYLKSLQFTGTQIGLLLAVAPVTAMALPPLWGTLADRTGRYGRVLTILLLGAGCGMVPLIFARGFTAVLVAIFFSAAFSSSITSMIDTLALKEVEKSGGTYSSLRLFGSLGFIVTSLSFGFLVDQIDVTTVRVVCGCFFASFLFALVTVSRDASSIHAGPKATRADAFELLKRRDVALFLTATCLHWIACAPYHGLLSIHVTALHLPPWVVSVSSSLGVFSEVLVMASWPWWGHKVSPRSLLVTAFLASALRWLGMSLVSTALPLALLGLFHGLTFGAFYLAAVAYMSDRAPGSLRATGQSLFVSATFGLGGLVGYVSAGSLYDALGGGHPLFAVAAAMELLPALVAWFGLKARVNPALPAAS